MHIRDGRLFAALGSFLLIGTAAPSPSRGPPSPATGAEIPFARGTALDTDCTHVGADGAGYRFIPTCPGRASSPSGRWAVVQGKGEQAGARLEDSAGGLLDELTALSDAMPFVVYWSAKSDWFFVNHYLGSGQDRLRVFEIVNRTAIERSSIFASATKIAVSRYPCLARRAFVAASGWRWSRDGRRIAMLVYARSDACQVEGPPGEWRPTGQWESLWMIGEAETGRIDPASVRVRPDGVGPMPADGPYARL